MLLERGDSIRVLDNLSVGTKEELASVANIIVCDKWESGKNVSLCVGDIRDHQDCLQATKGADSIVHLAAQSGVLPSIENPRFDCETNILGIVNMLEASRNNGVGYFVFASSSAPLGETDPPIHEEMVAKPLSPYGASKLAGEGYCSAYSSSFNIKTSVLRFSNVYGPDSGHKGSVVALFFKRALEGKPLIVYGSGGQTRDFIYIDDLCSAIIGALDSGVAGEVFQIATFKENTVSRIAELVKELVEGDTDLTVKVVHESERKGEVTRSYSDISKAQNMIGFNPGIDLEQGMSKTWEWFKNNYIVEK
jgi:UDP-glucose 4-epimerase